MNGYRRWTTEAVAEVIGGSPNGMTASEFASATELSPTRASVILARARDEGVLRTDGGGIGRAPARYSLRENR